MAVRTEATDAALRALVADRRSVVARSRTRSPAIAALARLAASKVDIVVFVVCAAIVLTGAFGVILLRNPVHAALSLVMTLFGVAVLFVAQEAHFLAAVQVIVYAGAIVVLFLFVIMLLGVDREEAVEVEELKGQRPSPSASASSCCCSSCSSPASTNGPPARPLPGASPPARGAERREARPVDLHRLPPGLRGHRRAARHRRGRRRRARPPAPARRLEEDADSE